MAVTRRRFLGTMAGAGAAALLSFRLPSSDPRGNVAVARSPSLERRGNDVAKDSARAFLDQAILRLSGQPTPAAGWKSLFHPGEKVALKLSCVPGIVLSSSRGLVWALVDALTQNGIRASDIVIWDRTHRELERAGFSPGGPSGSAAAVRGTDEYPGSGYEEQVEESGKVGTCFSRIVREADALINVPVLKDHDVTGVSIGMKNFYGAIFNPNKFHPNRGDPFIADLCAHPLIRSKLRLTVCDASRIQFHNGPAFFPGMAVEYGGLAASLDPVALDSWGWQLVEELRRVRKLPTLKEEGREPTYIAAAERRGLGTARAEAIPIALS